MRRYLSAPRLAAAALLVLSACGGGGGSRSETASASAAATRLGAADLAVLIAQGDATSEAIGLAYQQARGIPEANMIRVPIPSSTSPGSDTISATDFATLKAAIDARLPATVQATLVTWMQPSRVVGACTMGLTSALAFGYSAARCGGCVATQASSYYNSSTARPWTDLGMRPSMMLGASTLADAQVLIARGVAADATYAGTGAQGTGWLVRTTDSNRSAPRAADFATLGGNTAGGVRFTYINNAAGTGSDLVTGQPAVMFYMTGLPVVAQADSNSYLPGAVADTLTSFGGMLPGGNGQMPVTAWLQAGATASYGTVEEPCSYAEKFPRATVLVGRYQRGDTLIEAYWKSVQWPGEGLFVGEPLAHPWSR